MKHYTFSNFLVTDENRRAFDVARAIAELKAGQQMPVLLLGDDGSGKTHLLYAIVNHLRASSANAGLAYLTPTDFPEPVRQLIDDPTRVERASNAVLLVDQLDAIDGLDSNSTVAEELEAVVRIFLDNGHYVVLASNAHPDRIRQLPDGLGELLSGGTSITLPPHGAEAQARLIEEKIRQEQSGALEAQRAEIEALKQQVAEAASTRPAGDEDLQRRFEVAQAFGESIQRDLASAKAEIASLRSAVVAPAPASDTSDVIAELATLREQAAEAQRENENLREERARVQDDWNKTQARASELDQEVKTLREQLQTAWHAEGAARDTKEELSAAQERIAELESLLSTNAGEAENRIAEAVEQAAAARIERDQLRAELEETRARHDAAAQEASGLLQRAEGLVELVEANRARFRQVEETQREQIDTLEKLIAERATHSVHRDIFNRAQEETREARDALERAESLLATRQSEVDEANATIAALSAELDAERQAHQKALSDKIQALEATAEDRDRIMVELTTITSAHTALEGTIAQLTSERDGARSELVAARTQQESAQAEAAGLLAASNARAGDLEDRLQASEDALGMLRAVIQGFASDLASFAGEMRNGAQELDDMAGRLNQHEVIEEPNAEVPMASEEASLPEAPHVDDPIVSSVVVQEDVMDGVEAPASHDGTEETTVDLDPLDAIVEHEPGSASPAVYEAIAEFPQQSPAGDVEEPVQHYDNPSNGFDASGTAGNGVANGSVGSNGKESPLDEMALPEWSGNGAAANDESVESPSEPDETESFNPENHGW